MRWAAAHFCQSPAGPCLIFMALCLLRHPARRDPFPGERRGATARRMLGAVWVDDFALAQYVRRHRGCSRCAGLARRCPICWEHMLTAQLNDDYWTSLGGSPGRRQAPEARTNPRVRGLPSGFTSRLTGGCRGEVAQAASRDRGVASRCI